MHAWKKISGLTLLEIMLVLAIMVSFILLGINQYQQYQLQASFIDIKKNVDVLFQAMGRYYQANCRVISDASVAWVNGTTPHESIGSLAINGSMSVNYGILSSPAIIPFNLTELSQYLPSNWPTSVPAVSSVDGYTVSFIAVTNTKNAYQCWWVEASPGVITTQCGTPQAIQPTKTVVFMLSQVGVKIANDPTGEKTKAFLGATGANCASGLPDRCDGSTTPNYLVWQQLPIKSGSAINSDLWISQSQEAMFNQQYTHDVMYEMANPNYSTINDNSYYYFCGN